MDADRTITQLYHTAWTIEDGAPRRVFTLAQTKDGYLWLGTFSGLFRFDGVRFERYQPERGDPFPSQDISQLLATPDGGLWIGFRPYGVVFLEKGRGRSYGEREGLPLSGIWALALDREGAIWAGRLADSSGSRILIGRKSEPNGVSPPNKRSGSSSTSQGKLWVNGDTDLYCLSPGPMRFRCERSRMAGS